MTIQLEPGFWKTRNGLKVEVLAIRENIAMGYLDITNNIRNNMRIWELNGNYNKAFPCSHDIISKWIEPKKIYKLNEMWRIWYKITHKGTLRESEIQNIIIEGHITNVRQWIRCNKIKPIAITRADATEFFEGEGLED